MTDEKNETSEKTNEKIDWDVFATKFVTLVPGNQYKMLLQNWRVEHTDFNGKEKEKVPVLVFDVLRLDEQEFVPEPKIFTSGALSFVNEMRPVIENAEKLGLEQLRVVVKYSDKQRYSVVDLTDELTQAAKSGGEKINA